MPRAIYPGSFDPPTNGHIDVIERGARLFDELVVAIGHNVAKRTLFDVEERQALVRASVTASNVRVVAFSGLLIDAARREGAEVILRGLRTASDFELEFRNGLANRDLAGIETLFVLSEPRNLFVSSSLVKEIAGHGGDVSAYVPAPVRAALADKGLGSDGGKVR